MVTELLWFLRGDTNIKFLVDNNCHIWDGDAYKNYCLSYKDGHEFYEDETVKRSYTQEEFVNKIKTDDEFAKKWGDLGPVYGKQWRSWGGYKRVPSGWNHGSVTHYKEVPKNDQIANLINDLKTNPDSRRLMVNAWNVGELDSMVLPPCHYGFQVYTRELSQKERFELVLTEKYKITNELDLVSGKVPKRAISLMWNQRSVDTFLGLPFNIASYGLLLEIIAKLVNMVPDELIGNLGDTHLYLNHIEQAKEQIGREPYPLPTLNINTEWWPTESGEGGIGPISTDGFLQGLDNNIQHFIRCLIDDDLQLVNYQTHPPIKAPLSN
jgi:thymidylate synthase